MTLPKYFECATYSSPIGNIQFIYPDPIADPHTGSSQNLLRARSWLNDCINLHSRCKSHPIEIGSLPSRVLEITYDKICLRETHGMNGEYAILSHCWGPRPIITTTTQNIRSRCQNIDFSDLSKTFQHAVTVTQSLGIKYLWIDSLCILQDQDSKAAKADWEIESSKMGTYYACAKICIAASAASEGFVGCFFDRHPAIVQPSPLPIRLSGSDKSTMFLSRVDRVGDWMKIPDLMTPDGISPLGRVPPLESRGWVVQEIIMSRRILKFGSSELEWVCNSKHASEGHPHEKPPLYAHEKDCFDALRNLSSQISRFGPLIRHNIWYDIVEHYTKCELSYKSDMLPALSGVATQYQKLTGDRYFAGLWKSDLARGLLWRTPHLSPYQLSVNTGKARGCRGSSRPASYRAPTWSWASIDVTYINWDLVSDWSSMDGIVVTTELVDESKQGESCYELLDIRTDMTDLNKFGEVTGGRLSVQGSILPAYIWGVEEDTDRQDHEDNILLESREHDNAFIGRVDPDVTGYKSSSISIVPIVRPKQPFQAMDAEEERVLCLALEPTPGQAGFYTRVGVATIVSWKYFRDIPLSKIIIF